MEEQSQSLTAARVWASRREKKKWKIVVYVFHHKRSLICCCLFLFVCDITFGLETTIKLR
jgi:hypothetical protein